VNEVDHVGRHDQWLDIGKRGDGQREGCSRRLAETLGAERLAVVRGAGSHRRRQHPDDAHGGHNDSKNDCGHSPHAHDP
jgi:hypothetical protein